MLIGILLLSAVFAGHFIFFAALLVLGLTVVAVGALGGLGIAAQRHVPAFLVLPFMLLFLNLTAVAGLLKFLGGRYTVRWDRPARHARSRRGLHTEVFETNELVALRLAGSLKRRAAPELREVWRQLEPRINGRTLVLDLGGVCACDVRGLCALIGVVSTAEDISIPTHLQSVTLEILNAFSLAGLALPLVSAQPLLTVTNETVDLRARDASQASELSREPAVVTSAQ
jgi:ABC-type transporter Mla MlaB component